MCRPVVSFYHNVRYTAVTVSDCRRSKRSAVNILHHLTGKKIQSVKIILILFDSDVRGRIVYIKNSFYKIPLALLNKLTERMKVGEKIAEAG